MSLFEQVLALSDPANGVQGFMVLHSTSRGPATGGIRLYPYASEEDALADGIRLARAMTFKAAAAGLPVGGGKIVLSKPPDAKRRDALLAVGRAIEGMAGRFLAGRDVGVPVEDGAIVREETSYMVDESDVSEGGVGDLNLATALGVLAGAKAALSFQLGRTELSGVRVALQGAGGVGAWLAKKLAEEGAELYVCDSSPEALERLKESVSFTEVGVDDIYSVECELFAPCAIGGVLTESSASRLAAKIVAGSANNVLASADIGDTLAARGILFVPDYLVNAGALIQGVRFLLHGERRATAAIEAIGDTTASLLSRAKAAGLPPQELLDRELAVLFDLGDAVNL
jgi:leucine dehydrogenase